MDTSPSKIPHYHKYFFFFQNHPRILLMSHSSFSRMSIPDIVVIMFNVLLTPQPTLSFKPGQHFPELVFYLNSEEVHQLSLSESEEFVFTSYYFYKTFQNQTTYITRYPSDLHSSGLSFSIKSPCPYPIFHGLETAIVTLTSSLFSTQKRLLLN